MSAKNENTKRSEWRFRIDAFTPQTLPMARLAEYLTQLALILGETPSVHLVRIEGGSTDLVHEIDEDVAPVVQSRVSAVREGIAPKAANDAFLKINGYLAQDNTRAVLQNGNANEDILVFPGPARTELDFPPVKQLGTVSGVVVRVGGVGKRIPVLLDLHGKQMAGCYADRETAKKLGRHLFEPVRLYGHGQWSRGTEGTWAIDHFKIERFDPLDSATLSQVLEELRPIAANWGDDVFHDVEAIRGTGEL